jgi:hypothetical protein
LQRYRILVREYVLVCENLDHLYDGKNIDRVRSLTVLQRSCESGPETESLKAAARVCLDISGPSNPGPPRGTLMKRDCSSALPVPGAP